jgi:hypothetical protein
MCALFYGSGLMQTLVLVLSAGVALTLVLQNVYRPLAASATAVGKSRPLPLLALAVLQFAALTAALKLLFFY